MTEWLRTHDPIGRDAELVRQAEESDETAPASDLCDEAELADAWR